MSGRQEGRRKISLATAAAIVAFMGFTGLALAEEPEEIRKDWKVGQDCLKHGAKTAHGNSETIDPGTDQAEWTGNFVGYVQSVHDMEAPVIGVGFPCAAHTVEDATDLSVKVNVLKLMLPSETVAICTTSPGGFVSNDIPAWQMSVILKSALLAQPICGDGFYKTEAWGRLFFNGVWKPAAAPCKKNGPTPCLKQAITPRWHYFPFTICTHIDPGGPGCPR